MKSTFLLPLALLTLAACKPAPTLPLTGTDKPSAQTPSAQEEAAAVEVKPTPQTSLLRVNATQQEYNYMTPWVKKSPTVKNGLGAVLEDGVILTSADLVTDSTYISFSNADQFKSFPAKVIAVDYEANLALLAPEKESDAAAVKGMTPLKLKDSISRSAPVEMWQLEEEGSPLVTDGKVQNFAMEEPLIPGRSFLTYKVKAPMQSVENSYTLPVVSDGELTGMLTSYDSRNQIVQVTDISVIRSFVKDALDGKYVGFPTLGVLGEETTDPVFRSYLKLPEQEGGLYVSKINKRGSAARAGIVQGDVILSIDGQKIDSRGYYNNPQYGKLDWTRLVNGAHKSGDSMTVEIMRDGKSQKITVPLLDSGNVRELIPRYLYDKTPPYLIHGGLVFVELSLPYLKSYGDQWQNRAPVNLIEALQDDSDFDDRGVERIVVLHGCIPTEATLGYDSIGGVIVDSINGKPVKSLTDVARELDDPAPAIQTIGLARAPYKLYLSPEKVKAVNEVLKARVTPNLRSLPSDAPDK